MSELSKEEEHEAWMGRFRAAEKLRCEHCGHKPGMRYAEKDNHCVEDYVTSDPLCYLDSLYL